MKYTPRLTAPSTTDKNYRHTSAKGYNSCIHIGGGSVLPNCVGYAWGRWREILGYNPKLSRANAENWFGTKDGYARGKVPKVGAVVCWAKGKVGVGSDGAGHVAIVEEVKADGTIVTSNSGYKSTRFYLQTIKPPYNLTGYTFQGFIYIPVEFEVEKEVVKTVNIELNVLRKGSKGAQVKTLQRLLLALGFKMGNYGVDGSFGAATETAVKNFQKSKGLAQDGSVGPATWNALLK